MLIGCLYYILPMVTWSSLRFLSELVLTRHPWREVWQQAHLRRPCAWYCYPCLSDTDTSVLLRCFFAFVLPILEYCSPGLGLQLLNVTFSFFSARWIRWAGFVLIRDSCHWVIDVVLQGWVCCTSLIRTQITVCSASFHLLLLEFGIPELRSLEFEVSMCRTS